MISRAEQAGLDTGRALLLQRRGEARFLLGDADGVADLRDAADTLARHAHEKTAIAYYNLADAERGVGDMAAADAAYTTAAQWARRLALPYSLDVITIGQAEQAYHAADWDSANHLLSQITTTNQVTETTARIVRGRLYVAVERPADALTDAAGILGYATSSGNDESLYCGQALQARCHQALGNDVEALEACDRFLARWNQTGGYTVRAVELCEITSILVGAGRHQLVHDVALLLPEACRWRDALLLVADGKHAEAAALYEHIGSQPLAADAHLLAARKANAEGRATDAAHHAHVVLAFAEKTGATLYQRQAQQLLRASA
jgi:tetratricopeptide (TPR) repeat protein